MIMTVKFHRFKKQECNIINKKSYLLSTTTIFPLLLIIITFIISIDSTGGIKTNVNINVNGIRQQQRQQPEQQQQQNVLPKLPTTYLRNSNSNNIRLNWNLQSAAAVAFIDSSSSLSSFLRRNIVVSNNNNNNNNNNNHQRRGGREKNGRLDLFRQFVFTGIVEDIGYVKSITNQAKTKMWDGSIAEGTELVLKGASTVLQGDSAYIGCSIAVNGVCLTVTEFDNDSFKAGIAPETILKTNLANLSKNDPVNLERSLASNGRNSGHYVQGHVDNTGEIIDKQFEGDSLWITIQTTNDLMPYIVPKGYIAIDGTSLTVCEIDPVLSTFKFMLVSHTQQHTIIPKKKIGDKVNLEVDVVGKYAVQGIDQLKNQIDDLSKRIQNLEDKRR